MRHYRALPSGSVARARELRRDRTEAEKRLWSALRQTFPRAFRFQVPYGPYFVDFLSFHGKLVIEVDGGTHADAAEYDATRTRFLESEGYRVLRFWNNEVMESTDGVIARIGDALKAPLPAGESFGSALPPAGPERCGAPFTRNWARAAQPRGRVRARGMR